MTTPPAAQEADDMVRWVDRRGLACMVALTLTGGCGSAVSPSVITATVTGPAQPASTATADSAQATERSARTDPPDTDRVASTAAAEVPPEVTTAAPQAKASPDVLLSVPDKLTPQSPLTAVQQRGTAAVRVDVLTRAGGTVEVITGPDGGKAIRFPPQKDAPTSPAAVISVTPTSVGKGDVLSPGTADFTFGADFRRDAQRRRGADDDFVNLVQRGLASEKSQLKIEINLGRPACLVQGADGVVEVRAERAISANWHRVRCTRTGRTISLSVTELLPEGGTRAATVRGTGDTGALSWAGPVPLTVGGKVSARGDIITPDTNQLTGDVSEPVLIIED